MSVEAVEYVRHGLCLVPLEPGKKSPRAKAWNERAQCVCTEEAAGKLNGCGLGVGHAFSTPPTGAVDIDNLERAVQWFNNNRIDLAGLLTAPDAVQIRSGLPGHAKLLYRLPRTLGTVVLPDAGLELRCAADSGLTMQDALPPSRHPSGRLYEWVGDFRRIPIIPRSLLEVWENLASTGRRSRQQREQEDADADPVLSTLRGLGVVLRRVEAGKYAIVCPFEREHTTPDTGSSTAYLLAHYHGFDAAHFRCQHTHCADRSDADFLAAFGIGDHVHDDVGDCVRDDHDDGGTNTHTSSRSTNTAEEWPVLEPEAYHGLAGKIVRTIEPESEADPAALLIQVLVAFGALVGRFPYARVEGDRHYPALMAALVGRTSKARKGVSWGRVHGIFRSIQSWPRVESGLTTGEGVKFALRDPIYRIEYDKKAGTSDTVLVDEGIEDKRLLVVEAELAQALRVMQRPGNTLSVVIREAWDGRRLGSLTKSDAISATGVHVAVVAHITLAELRGELTSTDAQNGFANRFLYVCSKRSKTLPFGGDALIEESEALAAELEDAAVFARSLTLVEMNKAAKALWRDVYPILSEGEDGLYGAATARSEAQTLRLALIYALLDKSEVITEAHLKAALAVWEYAAASAWYVFGIATGNRGADGILHALRHAPGGLTRTEISGLFSKNQSAGRIGAALRSLLERKLVVREARQTSGRPVEVWRAATKAM